MLSGGDNCLYGQLLPVPGGLRLVSRRSPHLRMPKNLRNLTLLRRSQRLRQTRTWFRPSMRRRELRRERNSSRVTGRAHFRYNKGITLTNEVSRYQYHPPKYYRGPLHPVQCPPSSDPTARDYVPGPFSLPRLKHTYDSTIAPDLMTMTYQHAPPGVVKPECGDDDKDLPRGGEQPRLRTL